MHNHRAPSTQEGVSELSDKAAAVGAFSANLSPCHPGFPAEGRAGRCAKPCRGRPFSKRNRVDCDQEEPEGSLGGKDGQTGTREKLLPGAPETSKWIWGVG